jgi:hypothetical protein
MKSVQFHNGTMSLEIDSSGSFCFGEVISDYHLERDSAMHETSAADKMNRIIPTSAPRATICLQRALLLKCLAEMDAHDYLIVDVYEPNQPVVFRNDEQFCVMASAQLNAVSPVIDVCAEFGIPDGAK